MSAPDKKSLEAYNEFLTRKRWALIDGLWLLNGFYMWRKEEFVEPAIDSIAEKNRTEIEKLQDKEKLDNDAICYYYLGYENINRTCFRVRDWKEFAISEELLRTSDKVSNLLERFKITANPKYCDISVWDEKSDTNFSYDAQCDRNYLIEWAIKEGLRVQELQNDIKEAVETSGIDSSESEIVKKFHVNKPRSAISNSFHVWVYNKLKSLSELGKPQPTTGELIEYIQKDCKQYSGMDKTHMHYWNDEKSQDGQWSKEALTQFVDQHTHDANKSQ